MTKKIYIVILICLLFVALPFSTGTAAATALDCRAYHTVKAGDTLNQITIKYDVDLDYLVKYDGIYKDNPKYNNRRSIYVGQKICIPTSAPLWNEKSPTWANWPAADYTAKMVGNNLVIKTSWFNYPTSYNVKLSGTKIGLLSVKYHASTNTLTVPKNLRAAKTVCLKSVTTDVLVCRPILR
jgi:LysM repeat protein